MTVSFSSHRSDAIRAGLVAHAASRTRRSRAWRGAALLLAGALAGGGATATAFAATGARSVVIAQPSGQPVPSLGAAVPAPDGVIPGAPIVSMLEAPITRSVTAGTAIPLEPRPAAATHARVTITPLTVGSVSFGTDAAGNNPSGSWDAASAIGHARTWYDFPLNDSVDTLYVTPAGGFTGTVTIQYVNYVPTRLGVNAHGQTYGVSGSAHQGEPDLVAVTATNGKDGYAYATDLQGGPLPTSPADAITQQQANQGRTRTVPVYDSDGTTVIGDFTIG